jgi:mycothiol synthase
MDLRPVVPSQDLPALNELFDLAAECDGHRPIGEHKYLDLIQPDSGGAGGIVGEVDGKPVAYVAIGHMPDTNTCAMELALHPLHRDQETMVRIIGAGVDRVRGFCGSRVRMWAFQPNIAAVLDDMGFTAERELRQLRRSLPHPDQPHFQPEVEIEGFVEGRDEGVWLDVNNAAFAGHPENGFWTSDILEDRTRQPWFSPEGLRMAWIGGELAGFCWTKRHDEELGEIYVIAVNPTYQRRGLGRALVLEGMRSMSERGMSSVMLYVDADNTAGLALYRDLGFRLDHVDRSFVRDL